MKNIEYYLNEITDKKMLGVERRTKVYPFPEDKVIVVQKSERRPTFSADRPVFGFVIYSVSLQ